MIQDLFSQPPLPFTGEQLKRQGMKIASESAEEKEPGWNEKAYKFLIEYIKTHEKFLAEDIRWASVGIVPEPPSRRAWGSIIVRAAREGYIERIGYTTTNSPKSHKTPASLWQRK